MTILLTATQKERIYRQTHGCKNKHRETFFAFGSREIIGLIGGSMNKSEIAQCARAVSLFRGLYARVAHKLGVDVSYVSRIARGERKSNIVEKALNREFKKAVSVMRNGSVLSEEKQYMVVTLQCPRCKTSQKVHIDARPGFEQTGGEKVSCINCDHHFKLTIPEKIIGGPFPA